ncbi:autotransporter domain-containing protein [Candidatus Pelagibacter sp.]|nr:autotransporter domain-containing protein [Candidatus Pelagibacter sp.]
MKKIFLISIFYIFFFCSYTFAFIEFKQSKDISLDTEQARGINFKPDGTIMYVTNRKVVAGDNDESQKGQVTQYSLSTRFDISTATKTSQTNLLGGGGVEVLKYPHAIEFKPDGTKMFVVSGDRYSRIYQYNLTTAWDSSSAEFEASHAVTRDTDVRHLRTLEFRPDGKRMFTGGRGSNTSTSKIKEFRLANAWDLTSGVSTGDVSADLGSADNNLRNAQFDPNGKIMYIGGNDSHDIHKYTLEDAWDITSLSSTYTTFDLVGGFTSMRGFIFAANFTKLYVVNDAGTTSTILEYSPACSIITCSDPSDDGDVKAIVEANVELSKRIIQNINLPIFHRMEWLRRHKNKDNLSNLNAEIDFTNKKISKLIGALNGSKKEIDRSYDSDDWFKWSEGRISLGKTKFKNSSSRNFSGSGISVGADKIDKEDKDIMYGYAFQFGSDDIDIGNRGTTLDTDAFSLALYTTKLGENHVFTDALIGVSLLDIYQKRVTSYSNTLKGKREGQQIFGSFNFGKRIINEDLNLNPGIKLDLGYTRLKSFSEKTVLGNTLADALFYEAQNIKSALVTLGILLDKTDTDKEEDEIINHHGRLEYTADLSSSSDAEFYYLNDQSTVYNYKVDNKSKHNFRIGYGVDVTSISGWSLVGNFERFQSAKSHSNEIYLSVGYVPIDEMKFVFDVNNFNTTSLSLTNKVNGFDITVGSNYTLMSEIPDYGANLEISNKF